MVVCGDEAVADASEAVGFSHLRFEEVVEEDVDRVSNGDASHGVSVAVLRFGFVGGYSSCRGKEFILGLRSHKAHSTQPQRLASEGHCVRRKRP